MGSAAASAAAARLLGDKGVNRKRAEKKARQARRKEANVFAPSILDELIGGAVKQSETRQAEAAAA